MRGDGIQVCKEEQEEEEWRPENPQQHLGKHTQDKQKRAGKTQEGEEEEDWIHSFMLAQKLSHTHDHG